MNAGATIAVSTDPAAARYRCQDLPERYPVLVTSPPLTPVAAPASLDAFLAGVGPRAFRFAEAGLRQRDDALDAVQDAMERMLGYRDQPATEWTPLFWSILRRRIIEGMTTQETLWFRDRFPFDFFRDAILKDYPWSSAGPMKVMSRPRRRSVSAISVE